MLPHEALHVPLVEGMTKLVDGVALVAERVENGHEVKLPVLHALYVGKDGVDAPFDGKRDEVVQVAEVVVERLPVQAGFAGDFGYGDLFEGLFLQKLRECLGQCTLCQVGFGHGGSSL